MLRLLWIIFIISLLSTPVWSFDPDILPVLNDFWVHQKATFSGWLGASYDPGFASVVPPDSSLWAPGSLLRVSSDQGLIHAGSRDVLFRSVPVLGKARSDSSVIGQLIVGDGGAPTSHLPGILRALGIPSPESSTYKQGWAHFLNQQGIRRVSLAFPDAQVHRLGELDVAIHLKRVPRDIQKLVVDPAVQIVTSAVFIRTIQLHFDLHRPDADFRDRLKDLLGEGWSWRPNGTVERRGKGFYVAIQTARLEVAETPDKLYHFINTTEKTREILHLKLKRENY